MSKVAKKNVQIEEESVALPLPIIILNLTFRARKKSFNLKPPKK